jgi:dephospho-CoA kinase
MKVIGVSGLPGSGKSFVSKIAVSYGGAIVNMGDIIREEAERRGKSSGEVAIELREEEGDDVVAQRTISKINDINRLDEDKKLFVIEGIRSLDEVELFKEKFDEFSLISVFASPKTRFNRLKIRNRADDYQSFDEFKKRDLREMGFGIANVIAYSDFIIINENGIDAYEKQIDEVLNKL